MFVMRDNRLDPPNPILKKRYDRSIRLEGWEPEMLAKGWSRALEEILNAFEENLRETLLERRRN
jgi:hypothetical protein